MMYNISFSQFQKHINIWKNPQFPCEVGPDYCPHFHNEDMRYRGIKQQSYELNQKWLGFDFYTTFLSI